MKTKQRINEEGKRLYDIAKYVTIKWYQIMTETGLTLSVISAKKPFWEVQDKEFKTIKKGTFKQCTDYVLKEWKNKTKEYKFSYSELKPEARMKSVSTIISRMESDLEDAKINSYNKCQLETTCNRMRTQITWLKGALGI